MKRLTLENGLNGYSLLAAGGGHLQSAALLLIRLAWGWQLLESGHAHLSDVAGTAKNFAEWGIPFPTLNVYLAGNTEMVGGALLMLGLAARFISIPLFFNFCVAYLTASRETVKHLFTQNPDMFINDAAFPFLVTSVLILAFGPGKLSADAILRSILVRAGGNESPISAPGFAAKLPDSVHA
jgi:putative oxidoreductase